MVSESILVAASFEKPEQAEAAVRELGEMELLAVMSRSLIPIPRTSSKKACCRARCLAAWSAEWLACSFRRLRHHRGGRPAAGCVASALSSAGTLAVAGAAVGTLLWA